MKKLYVIGLFIIMSLFSRVEAYGACSSYGSFAIETYNGMCECMYGYGWSTDFSGDKVCKSKTLICPEAYGYASRYSYLYDSCECSDGYFLGKDSLGEVQCLEGRSYCRKELGNYASYSSSKKACICDEGYTIRDGQCKEEAYSLYGVMTQLKDYSAIVVYKEKNSIFEKYYEIDFSYGCTKVEDFVGKVIVLNFMYDKRLNYGDYLVLPNTEDLNGDNQHCKITSANEVDEDVSLYSCEEIFGSHSYESSKGKCACDEGYEFSNSQCVKKQTNTYYSPTVTKVNSELENAIARMYLNELTKFNTVTDFNPSGELTREQASKFYVQFATSFLGKRFDPDIIAGFDDIGTADPSLQSYITLAYNFGLFKGSNGKFKPFDKLSRAQALAVAIRSKYGYQNETYGTRYSEYYDLAKSYGLIDGLGFDYSTLGSINITRGEVATLLYRLSNLK